MSRGLAQWQRVRHRFETLLEPQFEHRPAQAIQHLVEDGYRQYVLAHFRDGAERIEDLAQLANFAAGYDSYDRLLADVSLREGFRGERLTGAGIDQKGVLVLSTIHQAKGLEWVVVMLIGLSEGQFPHPKAFRDPEQLEEERRLFYVAVTRAKEQLYLVVPMTRMTPSGAVITRPSLFLRELPPERYDVWRASDQPLVNEASESWLSD
jgi:DNA helicase-2/ATP-dependent DNA helicase PcrA